jgi:NAD+ synthase
MTQDEADKFFSGRERVVFEIYKRLNNANRHKMDTIPFVL